MTSTNATPGTAAEAFATRVKCYLTDEDRTPGWLSRKAEIAYNTLRRQLDRPELLTFGNAVRISDATGVPVQEDVAA
ncbi:hypothetical protein [Microbacterium jejuense]|uniref:hypothetical protein n=1 Tax=Microbacterium jejuense TaxID=1263637 RepID=UPI0031E63D6E